MGHELSAIAIAAPLCPAECGEAEVPKVNSCCETHSGGRLRWRPFKLRKPRGIRHLSSL